MTLSGFAGWRVPSVRELLSIVDFGGPTLVDSTAFPNCPAFPFWSSTPYVLGGDHAWLVDFRTARVFSSLASNLAHVRCVR